MEYGVLSSTIKQSANVVLLAKAHLLSSDSDDIVQIRTHSVDLYSFNSETRNIELESSAPIQNTIISAHIVTNCDWSTDRVAFVTSDFSFTLLWFENDEITTLTSTELRHEGIKPTIFSPIISSGGKYVFVSLYPTSLFLITIGDALTVKEIHFTSFIPIRMHYYENHLFFFTDNHKLQSVDIESFDNSTIGYNDNILKSYEEFTDKEVLFCFQYISIVEENTIKVYEYSDNSFKIHQQIPNDHKENITFINITDTGYFIGTKDHIYYKTSSDHPEKFISIFSPINCIVLRDNFILAHQKYEQTSLTDLNSLTINRTSKDLSYLTNVFKFNDSVTSSDSLIVSSSRNPSELVFYGEGNKIEIIEEGNSSERRNIEKVFVIDDSDYVFTGDSFTEFNHQDKYESFCCDKRTKSISQEIQVTEDCIKTSTISVDGLEIQNSIIYNDIVVFSSPGSYVVKIYEYRNKNEIHLKREIDVCGEPSCFIVFGNNLFVSTWSNNSVCVYNIDSGELICSLSSPVSSPYVIRSLLYDENKSELFIGTSSGYLITCKYKDQCFDTDSVKSIRISFSPLSLTYLPHHHSIFVFSTEKSGICEINEENKLDFYKSDLFGITNAEYFNDSLIMIKEDGTYMIGKISDTRELVEYKRFTVDGFVKSINLLEDRTIVLLSVENADSFALSFYNPYNFVLQRKVVQKIPNFVPNDMKTVALNGHNYIVVAGGLTKGDKKGDSYFYEYTESSLVKITNMQFDFDVTSVSYSNKKVVFASGSSLYVINVSTDNSGGLTLSPENKQEGMMLCVELKSFNEDQNDENSETGGLFVWSDIFKSCGIFDANTNQICLSKIDYNSKQLTSSEFVDENSVISCDVYGGVYYLKHQPSDDSSDDNKSLVTKSLFSLGEFVTKIMKWRPSKPVDNIYKTFVVSTINGGLHLLCLCPKEIVSEIQKKMDEETVSFSALTPYYCNEKSFNYANVDEIEDENLSQQSKDIINWMNSFKVDYM